MKLIFKILLILFIVCLLVVPVIAAEKSSKKAKKVKEYKPQIVEFQADDKFNIVADLYIPPKLSKKKSVSLIILVHGLGQSKADWKPYALEFMGKGYSVLAIDLRGHGASGLDKHKKKKYWRNFQEKDWKYISSDIVNAVKTLKENNPQVNTHHALLIGADLGSTASIIAASKMKDDVKGLVLISPYNNIKGIEARIPLVEYGPRPLLIFVSEFDKRSYSSTQDLMKYAQGQHQITLVKKAGCGLALFKFEPKLKEVLNSWIKENFPLKEEAIPASLLSKKKKKKESKESH